MEIFISALGGKISNMGKGVFERFPADIMIKDDIWNLNFVKRSCVEKTKSLRLNEVHILKNMVLFIWEIRKIAKQNC